MTEEHIPEYLKPLIAKMEEMGKREPGEICTYEVPLGMSREEYKKSLQATTLAPTP